MKGSKGEIALYLHIPFCIARCPYCDFYSITDHSEERKASYLSGIERDLHIWEDTLAERDLLTASCYFGGGTPSLLSEDGLIGLLRAIRKTFPLKGDAEITLEANPETLNLSKLQRLREGGFNRISIGVQSFDDALLSSLGRVHDAAKARETIREAKEVGFDNLSLDLMFGIPGQTCDQWRRTLHEALELRPAHISAYNLTIEPETPFHESYSKGALQLPSETDQLRMLEDTIEMLTCAGYEHYEISNYALPGLRCRHNLTYWRNGEYLGLGPGASSYVDGKRIRNIEDLNHYIERVEEGVRPVEEEEVLQGARKVGEALMLGLRLMEGVDAKELVERCGADPMERFAPIIDALVEEGLLLREGLRIRLTRRGLHLSNEVFMRFL